MLYHFLAIQGIVDWYFHWLNFRHLFVLGSNDVEAALFSFKEKNSRTRWFKMCQDAAFQVIEEVANRVYGFTDLRVREVNEGTIWISMIFAFGATCRGGRHVQPACFISVSILCFIHHQNDDEIVVLLAWFFQRWTRSLHISLIRFQSLISWRK